MTIVGEAAEDPECEDCGSEPVADDGPPPDTSEPWIEHDPGLRPDDPSDPGPGGPDYDDGEIPPPQWVQDIDREVAAANRNGNGHTDDGTHEEWRARQSQKRQRAVDAGELPADEPTDPRLHHLTGSAYLEMQDTIRAEKNGNAPASPARAGLNIRDAREVAAYVDALPPPSYLFRPVWPSDAYGVLAAEDKAGKTWAMLDAAISVASGTPWLGAFPVERAGRVLAFLGEGGERKMVRRARAISAARGIRFEDLPLRLAFRVPQLSSAYHQQLIAEELAAHPDTVLTIVDPLYLAARGAKGSDLYAMADHLGPIQETAQDAGSGLVISTHYNKTGDGKGPKRITGVGPGAWGRVLATFHVEHRATLPDKTSDVILAFQFRGDEIPESDLRLRRRVRAENPDDLASPLHYATELLPDDDEPAEDPRTEGLRPAAKRVLAHLEESELPLAVRLIGDRVAADGRPLKARTIQDALKALRERDLIDTEPDATDTGAAHYWATSPIHTPHAATCAPPDLDQRTPTLNETSQ